MLNQDTKRKINNLRNILVGKVPDPKSQVDQITLALIYKAMYDMDKRSKDMGGQAAFFKTTVKKYSWDKIVSSSISGAQRVKLYEQALDKFSKASHFPRFFREVFNQSTLPYKDAETLRLFVKEIDSFDYNNNKNGSDNSEGLGDAFEHILSYLGSQGDAGQFRTPRCIIDFIVEVVEPKKNETIFDPACGTAGFLISAFKSVIRKNSTNYKPKDYIHSFEQTDDLDASSSSIQPDGQFKGKKLVSSEWKKLYQNIKGFDISPDMVKLSSVNLFLHKFKDPDISPTDTLTDLNVWGTSEYDVILANPPFMTPRGGIRPHNKFSIKSNRSEVLFVEYIMEHLKIGGRAGIIVPEGIIFKSNKAYKSLRKRLIEDNFLWAVVSLPSGVFQPYSGVKTSILFLDKKRAKKEDQILFIDVKNDGFDLGANRRRINNNDLPQAFEDFKKHKKGKFDKSSISFLVDKRKLSKDQSYNLNLSLYRSKEILNSKWEIRSLASLEEESKIKFLRGQGILKKDIVNNGKNKCIHYGELYTLYDPIIKRVISQTDSKGRVLSLKGDVLSPSTTTADAMGISIARSLNEDNIIIGGDINIIRTGNSYLISDYLALLISNPPLKKELSKYAKGSNILHLSNSDLRKLSIPLPPLSVQKEIVAEVEGYQSIINGAKQIIDNWKPAFKIDPEWQIVKLGDVCELKNGYAFKSKDFCSEGIPVVRISDIKDNGVNLSNTVKVKKSVASQKFVIEKGDLLIAMSGATTGKTGIYKHLDKSYQNQRVGNFKITAKEKIIASYRNIVIITLSNLILSKSYGGAQPNISPKIIHDIKIPLPPLSVQKGIVEKIQEEEKIIQSNKKLIKINEEKIIKRLSQLFNK